MNPNDPQATEEWQIIRQECSYAFAVYVVTMATVLALFY